MSRSMRNTLRRGALPIALLPTVMLMPAVVAQNKRPEPSAGAQPAWQKPAGTASQGQPTQGVSAAGAPATAIHPLPVGAPISVKKTPQGEGFFIVASVDLQKSQMLLKYPTEVTLLMRVDSATKFADDSGAPLKLSDFRAGDTVWVSSTNNKGDVTAARVRKGRMDVADLHRYYLDYPEIK